VQGGYLDALRRSLAYREISVEEARIDYDERGTVEAVLRTLDEQEERSVLFGLEIAERLDTNVIVPRLPRALLRHPSPAVRAHAIKLLALHPDATTLEAITQMLQDENREVRAEAIRAACDIFKGSAIAIVRPYLESPDPRVKRRALECSLRHGDLDMRDAAIDEFRKMITDGSSEGEAGRVEVARLMGEAYNPAFAVELSKLIAEDSSYRVTHEAMAAAGKAKYPEVIKNIISRLGFNVTKAAAREALIQYGEIAVTRLRTALFDTRIVREVRLNIPRTLSKTHSQSAMNALLAGLLEEDRVIRFKVILALEEICRRFPDLTVDRDIIETAIVSDVMLYCQRFAIFFALFGHEKEPLPDSKSLLKQTLTDSMERVKERVMWLLSLIFSQKDIRRAWAGLRSKNPGVRAHAIEFLDNLLPRNMKRYVFCVFSDLPETQRFAASLELLGIKTMNTRSALHALFEQGDVWLRAATVWEIGFRRLDEFRDDISSLLDSDDPLLRETAGAVIHRI
jgi:ATP:ADP antiporter, AAA family